MTSLFRTCDDSADTEPSTSAHLPWKEKSMTQTSVRINRARATGLQTAQVGLAAQLRSYRDTLGPEYEVLLELHAGTVALERRAFMKQPARVRRLRRPARLAEAA